MGNTLPVARYWFCAECVGRLERRGAQGLAPQDCYGKDGAANIQWPTRADDVALQSAPVIHSISSTKVPAVARLDDPAMPHLAYTRKLFGAVGEDGMPALNHRDGYYPRSAASTFLLDYDTYFNLHDDGAECSNLAKDFVTKARAKFTTTKNELSGLRAQRQQTNDHMLRLQPDGDYGYVYRRHQECAQHALCCTDHCRAVCAEAHGDINFQLQTLSYYSFSSTFDVTGYISRVNKGFDTEEARLEAEATRLSFPPLLGAVRALPFADTDDALLQALEDAGYLERVMVNDGAECAVFLQQNVLLLDKQWGDAKLGHFLPKLVSFLGGATNKGFAAADVPLCDLATRTACSVDSLLQASLAPLDMPVTATPPGLGVQLRDYQSMELSWMLDREAEDRAASVASIKLPGNVVLYYQAHTSTLSLAPPSHQPPGGILAAEMGLGKTITMAALFLANPPAQPTLVLEEELMKLYSRSPYQRVTLEACGFKPLPVSNLTKPSLNTTLVIVPTSLIAQWALEIKNKTNLRFIVLTGQGDRHEFAHIASCDVAFISTAVLTHRVTQGRTSSTGPKRCNLHKYHWHRVVVDESHFLKNPESTICQTCSDIEATTRWALTGTPMPLHANDIGTLSPTRTPRVLPACK